MAQWFELSAIAGLRVKVGKHLEEEEDLPPSKDKNETAAAFWERVEKAGLLEEALDTYDIWAEVDEEQVHTPRETKKMFADRIEREGRQAEVEEARNSLMEDGYSQREIHEKLVRQFQPRDGTKTRPWVTPNPWEQGRLFRKKEDQDRVVPKRDEWEERKWRLHCAKWRREERVALANARRRARELEAAAAAEKAKLAEAKPRRPQLKRKVKRSPKAKRKPVPLKMNPRSTGSGSLWTPRVT